MRIPDEYFTTDLPTKPGIYLWEHPVTKEYDTGTVEINAHGRAWITGTGRFCDLMGGRWSPLYTQEVVTQLEKIVKMACQNWAEAHRHAQKVAREWGVTELEVEGCRLSIPTIETLIDLISQKAKDKML